MTTDEQRNLIIEKVASLIESKEAAALWYETEILMGFGYTPRELVAQGRYEAVLTHIKRKSLGGYD